MSMHKVSFACQAAGQTFAMALEVDCGVSNAVQKVLLLQVVEPLIQSLEQALDTGLDWIPDPQGSVAQGSNSQAIPLTIDWSDQTPVHTVHLSLPSGMWSQLAAWEAHEVASVQQCRWGKLDACLGLSELAVPEQQLQALSVGGLVLLPESFDSGWSSGLQLFGGQVHLAGQFDPAGVCWTPASAASPGASVQSHAASPGGFTIECQLQIDPSSLLGGSSETSLPLSHGIGSMPVSLKQNGDCLFSGHLVDLGAGYGLLVDRCHEHVT